MVICLPSRTIPSILMRCSSVGPLKEDSWMLGSMDLSGARGMDTGGHRLLAAEQQLERMEVVAEG